jgi:peptidyl-tRNA hydrolase, PTH2 family
MNVKQVIVVRKDIKMSVGKTAAQVAHAAMKVFLDRAHYTTENLVIPDTEPMREWAQNSFTKIVVGCETEEEIYQLADSAEELNIPFAVIVDNGFTEFKGKKTTCIAIGPDESDKIDLLTKNYKLL